MSSENALYEDFTLIPGAVQLKKNNNDEKPFSPDQQTSQLTLLPDDPRENQVTSFRTLLSNFAASTTAHGFGRIAASSSVPKCIIWCLISAGFYVMLSWMCATLVLRYIHKPVVSRMEMSFEESLNFPAVTVCNLNMLNRQKLKSKRVLSQILEKLEERRLAPKPSSSATEQRNSSINTNSSSPSIDEQIQDMESSRKNSLLSTAKTEQEREILQDVDVDTSLMENKYLDMIVKSVPDEKLSKIGHDLEEMVKYCRWSSFNCGKGSLKKLWRHFWHWKYGNCYVFNSGLNQNGSLSLPVLRVERAGPYNGLELDIFVNQKQYTKLTEEAGVRVVLTEQGRMPFPFDEGFSVPTGFSTSVGIVKRYVKRVDPYQNNSCFDETLSNETHNIYREKYHLNYSCQACRMSCLATTQVTQCNCSDPRFPNNSSACFTKQQEECVREVNRKFAATGMDCITKCPQPCFENSFSYTVSSSQWSTSFKAMIKKKYGRKYSKADHLASENVLRLQIFYQDLSVSKTINEEAYKIENLLADIGGQLGLWIGVSIMTGVELLEFIINLLTYLCDKRKEKGNK